MALQKSNTSPEAAAKNEVKDEAPNPSSPRRTPRASTSPRATRTLPRVRGVDPMALTTSTYTPASKGHFFQDAAITPAALADGTLVQRFEITAFPKKGVKVAGTDGNGRTVPKAARPMKGAGS
jgi:hypothetical protein